MANIIVADGQYQTVIVNTTLVEVAGKLYYIKNTSASQITITYGGDSTPLQVDDLGIFMFDGTLWSDLTPSVTITDANPTFETVTITGVGSGEPLSVGPDTNKSASIGRVRLGGLSDSAIWGHYDQYGLSTSSLRQFSSGTTYLQAPTAERIDIRVGVVAISSFTETSVSLYQDVTYLTPTSTGGFIAIAAASGDVNTATKMEYKFTVNDSSVGRGREDVASITFVPTTSWSTTSYDARLDFNVMQNGAGNGVTPAMSIASITGNTLIGSTVDNGTDILQAYGTTANNTGVWAVLSDKRVKENVRIISDPLQKALDLASCVKQYNYIEEANMVTGLRTQYIAQDLITHGFEGHVIKIDPNNEAVGVLLGWAYGDQEVLMEIPEELDEEGNVIKEATIEITTKRVVTKEGDKLLQVENNFAPYAFPAISALNDKVVVLEDKVTVLEEENLSLKVRLKRIEKKLGI